MTVRTKYGVTEVGGLTDGAAYHGEVDHSRSMSLAQVAEAGGRISRLRLLSEIMPGVGRIADVSYIHATLPDGAVVPVKGCAVYLTPLRHMKGALIRWAKEEGVYAKALGLLDESNWSIVYG